MELFPTNRIPPNQRAEQFLPEYYKKHAREKLDEGLAMLGLCPAVPCPLSPRRCPTASVSVYRRALRGDAAPSVHGRAPHSLCRGGRRMSPAAARGAHRAAGVGEGAEGRWVHPRGSTHSRGCGEAVVTYPHRTPVMHGVFIRH